MRTRLAVTAYSLLLTVAIASSGFAKSASAAKKPRYTKNILAAVAPKPHKKSILHLLSYRRFRGLSQEKRARYLQTLRLFVIDQETKQARHHQSVGQLNLDLWKKLFRDEAEAEEPAAAHATGLPDEGKCNEVDDKTEYAGGIKTIISDHHDVCIKAGQLVCMAPSVKEGKTGLSCRNADLIKKYPGLMAKLQGTCAAGEIQCAMPFFYPKEGDKNCASANGPNLAQRCAKKSISAQELANKLSDSSIKENEEQYRKAADELQEYCGDYDNGGPYKFTNAHWFDQDDCEILKDRIKPFTSPDSDPDETNTNETAENDGKGKKKKEDSEPETIAHCEVGPSAAPAYLKAPLRYKIMKNNEGNFKTEFSGDELKNWKKTSEMKDITTPSIASSAYSSDLIPDDVLMTRVPSGSNEVGAPVNFLAFYGDDDNGEEKAAIDCRIRFLITYIGSWSDKGCTVKAFEDQKLIDATIPDFKGADDKSFFGSNAAINVKDQTDKAAPVKMFFPKAKVPEFIEGKKLDDNKCQLNLIWTIQGKQLAKGADDERHVPAGSNEHKRNQ